MLKILKRTGLFVGIPFIILLIFLHGFAYFFAMQPNEVEEMPIVTIQKIDQKLKKGDKVKILNWNVQYMGSKNYIFFYDVLDGSGKDDRPSAEDIAKTLKEVAKVIIEQKPDFILLQEIDENSKRTDYQDQLTQLLALLPKEYGYHTSAFYHQAAFVPHPRIMGRVGMKLSIISRYPIVKARRHQLSLMPNFWVMQQFNLKRCVLEATVKMDNGEELVLLNTHLDAFAQGTNTMENQVKEVATLLDRLEKEGKKWLIGGDFNLLPHAKAFYALPEYFRVYYKLPSEITSLINKYQVVPTMEQMNGSPEKYYTHFPNDPRAKQPDRTIDYIFLSKGLKIINSEVLQKGTWHISDHLPIITEIEL